MILAQSKLPVSDSTICYGSSDGGSTVHKSNLVASKKIKELAKELNLAVSMSYGAKFQMKGPFWR